MSRDRYATRSANRLLQFGLRADHRGPLRLTTIASLAVLVLTFSVAFAGENDVSPQELTKWLRDIKEAADRNESPRVIELSSKILEQTTQVAEAYYWRGREYLRSGDAIKAMEDFNAFLRARPDQASRLWERGIAAFYAEDYAAGARQFADYQNVDDADVENAVWHVLCRSYVTDFRAAQREIMCVGVDRRVPMMEIYQLFRGEIEPAAVLAAADRAAADPKQHDYHRFYAHLYVGYYYLAQRDPDRAREHLKIAVERYPNHDYMCDVARMHLARPALNERPVVKRPTAESEPTKP